MFINWNVFVDKNVGTQNRNNKENYYFDKQLSRQCFANSYEVRHNFKSVLPIQSTQPTELFIGFGFVLCATCSLFIFV